MLCEVETDKATIGWEAQEEGFVAALLLPDGAKDVPVGAPAAVLVEEQVQHTQHPHPPCLFDGCHLCALMSAVANAVYDGLHVCTAPPT